MFSLRRNQRQKQRQYKTRIINRNRGTLGFYAATFLKMKEVDSEQFFKYTRMDVETFNKLLGLVSPMLQKKRLPDSIGAEQCLAVTLNYLSQGSSMQNIAWSYQLGHSTVHYIIHDVCRILWIVLNKNYLKSPSTTAEWEAIVNDFWQLWNFPNCVGALDGKHISIQAPPKSGSLYFNYKKTFSVVLLAACDAKYNFTLIDVGAYGSQSDGGIFRESTFEKALNNSSFNLPSEKPLPGTNTSMPYVFVADEAFPLKKYIMRPYPGRHLVDSKKFFNYRLSRARRIIKTHLASW
ncbi:hypothetical protein RN001_005978 [Aquatica leii]|uniref:DDE Tnp4 domain-containing protein n=1 Tax=Aquatica leii TaxID=1421715 RepID=A0AAN7SJD1_9COLE|nr:hypothetical protein RN001_005978 [Aquatica leii]